MYFVLLAKDKPGALQARLDTREAHLAYVRDQGCVAAAGPFLDDDGNMVGSMMVLDVADRAAAEAFAANDPYGKAGVFEEVTLTPWKWVIGAPA